MNGYSNKALNSLNQLLSKTKDNAFSDWNATPGDVQILETLASMDGFHTPISRLHGEAMVLELIASTFEKMCDTSTSAYLTPRERSQLKRVEDLIQTPGPLPDLAALTTAGGLSLSSLRRFTQKAHGCATLAHARAMCLAMAKDHLKANTLSVSQAAEVAGFSTPENFSPPFGGLLTSPLLPQSANEPAKAANRPT